jgi:hypothetical protein
MQGRVQFIDEVLKVLTTAQDPRVPLHLTLRTCCYNITSSLLADLPSTRGTAPALPRRQESRSGSSPASAPP